MTEALFAAQANAALYVGAAFCIGFLVALTGVALVALREVAR